MILGSIGWSMWFPKFRKIFSDFEYSGSSGLRRWLNFNGRELFLRFGGCLVDGRHNKGKYSFWSIVRFEQVKWLKMLFWPCLSESISLRRNFLIYVGFLFFFLNEVFSSLTSIKFEFYWPDTGTTAYNRNDIILSKVRAIMTLHC